MDENKIREIIREEMGAFFKSDRVTFYKLVQMLDGRNFQLGTSVGTNIGLSASAKFAFHGATPVIKSASGNQAALSLDVDVTGGNTVDKAAIDANFTSIQTLVNQLRTDLINKGLIKGSA